MAGINLSQLNITKPSVAPVRKKIIHLNELSDSYKNPDKEHEKCVNNPLVEREQSASSALVKEHECVSNALVEREQKTRKRTTIKESVSNPLVNALGSALVGLEKSVSKALVEREQKRELSDLSKQQDFFLNYIFEMCSSIGQRETPKIQNHSLLNIINTTPGNLRYLILNLRNMGFLKIVKTKNGPNGWRVFELPENVYKSISNQRNISRALVERYQSASNPLVNALGSALVEPPSSSSSSINITTTNYKADALAKIELSEALTLIGFNQGHIEQLLRDSSLTPEEIQNSLNAFAFDLGFEDVKRKVRSPIGLIMKLLKNGQAYISEKGYESEEDRLYRELIERAEKKNEEKKNLQAKLVEVKFEEWLDNISDDEKRNLAEPIGEFMGIIHREELKEYFKREVYE
ncbi:MAG: hypothetical protein ACXVLQ_16010 [Bacteriovorax sp.]